MELSILMTMHWGPSSSSNCKNLSTTMRRKIDSPLSLTPRLASPCRSFMGRGKGVRLMARNRLNTKSLYISSAVSNFCGKETKFCAGFEPVGRWQYWKNNIWANHEHLLRTIFLSFHGQILFFFKYFSVRTKKLHKLKVKKIISFLKIYQWIPSCLVLCWNQAVLCMLLCPNVPWVSLIKL